VNPQRVYDVVVVGAGHGGVHLATSLVKSGYAGSVALLGAELAAPYERPPLSKGYLLGAETFDDIAFRPATYWATSPVELLLGRRVTRVLPERRCVVTADGEPIGYRRLVWAAGGRARELPVPGQHLAGVHSVRTLADANAVRAELSTARAAVVIGGGYIGLETAAAFRKLGVAVTVVEQQPRLLARVTSPVVSAHFLRLHRAAGVDVRLGAGVTELRGTGGRVRSVALTTGEELPADLVIVGVGLVPNIEPLAAAGLACGNGVEVDERCRTTAPDISAIGDCASHPNRFAAGARIRLECVQNATEHARIAAADILGTPQQHGAVPWFWSNQYDVKFKTAGLLTGYDRDVVRGDPDSGAFTVGYLRDGRLVALDCVNTAADFSQGRLLVERGVAVDPHLLADPTHPLRTLPPIPDRRSARGAAP